jgi:ribosomal protein S18 acetylase RimI-like enzyme
MEIHVAHPSELSAVAEVHIEARNAYYDGHVSPADLAHRAALLRDFYPSLAANRFDVRLLSATVDGTVVGMALTGPPKANLGPWVGELYQIHVRPTHWRQGIGTRLHDECVTAWRAAGITVGVVEAWVQNERARAFYESHGWRPDGHTREDRDGTYLRLRRAIN